MHITYDEGGRKAQDETLKIEYVYVFTITFIRLISLHIKHQQNLLNE